MECKFCAILYESRLKDLESRLPEWKRLDDRSLLLIMGENVNKENVIHIRTARENLSASHKFTFQPFGEGDYGLK